MPDWRSSWDGDHAIYVSDRHKAVHYRAIADFQSLSANTDKSQCYYLR